LDGEHRAGGVLDKNLDVLERRVTGEGLLGFGPCGASTVVTRVVAGFNADLEKTKIERVDGLGRGSNCAFVAQDTTRGAGDGVGHALGDNAVDVVGGNRIVAERLHRGALDDGLVLHAWGDDRRDVVLEDEGENNLVGIVASIILGIEFEEVSGAGAPRDLAVMISRTRPPGPCATPSLSTMNRRFCTVTCLLT